MMLITFHGTQHTPSYSAHRVKRTGELYSGMHAVGYFTDCHTPFFTQSTLISLESRFIQQCSLKVTPTYTQYAPDGRSLLFVTAAHQLMFMSYGKESEEAKEQWQIKVLPNQKDSVR